MARSLIFVLLLSCIALSVQAQSNRNDAYDSNLKGVPLKERIVVGGGLGFSFGSQQDFISVSPLVGFKVTERLLTGASFTYRFTKYKIYNPAIKLTDYGISPFLRYTVFKGIFLQTEYEYLNYEFPITQTESRREGYSSFLAGGGFLQPIGDKAAFYLLAMYNFSYRDSGVYSPYDSPLILRGGITIGF